MAAKTTRQNTPTEQNKEDNSLVLYRLEKVEEAVGRVEMKLAGLNNPTKEDLREFQANILMRFDEKNKVLQDQIDEKADMKTVDERWGYVKAGFGVIASGIVTFVIYYITAGRT